MCRVVKSGSEKGPQQLGLCSLLFSPHGSFFMCESRGLTELGTRHPHAGPTSGSFVPWLLVAEVPTPLGALTPFLLGSSLVLLPTCWEIGGHIPSHCDEEMLLPHQGPGQPPWDKECVQSISPSTLHTVGDWRLPGPSASSSSSRLALPSRWCPAPALPSALAPGSLS